MTQKLNRAENKEAKDRLLTAITTHSVVSWAHINLLGEYDFSDEKLQPNLGATLPHTKRGECEDVNEIFSLESHPSKEKRPPARVVFCI